MRALFGLMASVVFAGCYTYSEPVAAPLPPGARVSAELSDSGTLVLARAVGPGVAAVEGRLLRATTMDLELAVTTVRQHNGAEADWRGERLIVPRQLVAGLHERKLSRPRTVLFAGVVAVGAVILRQAFQGDGGGSPPIVGTGPTGPR